MNTLPIVLIIMVGVGVIISLLNHSSNKQKALHQELLEEREKASKKIERKEKKLLQRAKKSFDKEFWKTAFFNADKAIKTARVSEKQYAILLMDEEFLSNESGVYANIKGIYRNNKIMIKLPSRKGMKYGHNNQKTK